MSVFEKAIAFAAMAHEGACRKGGRVPYIVHPMEAAAIAASMTEDPVVLAAAVLHDVLEDTPHTEKELLEQFGAEVTRLVKAETEHKRHHLAPETTWRRRKQETILHLRQEQDLSVLILALSDKLSNLRTIARGIAQRGEDYWSIFHQQDPEAQRWYYQEVGRALEPLRETDAWQEYHRLLGEIWKRDAQPVPQVK